MFINQALFLLLYNNKNLPGLHSKLDLKIFNLIHVHIWACNKWLENGILWKETRHLFLIFHLKFAHTKLTFYYIKTRHTSQIVTFCVDTVFKKKTLTLKKESMNLKKQPQPNKDLSETTSQTQRVKAGVMYFRLWRGCCYNDWIFSCQIRGLSEIL